jgi:pSer/pThr/pTyr-binding forkhead associated (FHA) protein
VAQVAQPSAAPQPPPPAARPVVRGRLVVIAKSGADGPSYPIGDTLDVGRTEGQIIVGEDPYLSPRHVRIVWTGGKLVLRDLASTNGVYIRLVAARDMTAGKGGSRAPATPDDVPGEVAVPLHDQDLILVGQQVLRFESAMSGSQADAGFGPATEHGTLLFGSPAAPRYARLSQRTVEGVTRDVYYVRKVETVLGRESGDVVFTEDPFLSRRHAAIRVLARDGSPLPPLPAGTKPNADGIQFALVDLGSSNGSFLRIRNEIDLIAGDHFRVGQQLFRVDFEGGVPSASPPQRGNAG